MVSAQDDEKDESNYDVGKDEDDDDRLTLTTMIMMMRMIKESASLAPGRLKPKMAPYRDTMDQHTAPLVIIIVMAMVMMMMMMMMMMMILMVIMMLMLEMVVMLIIEEFPCWVIAFPCQVHKE